MCIYNYTIIKTENDIYIYVYIKYSLFIMTKKKTEAAKLKSKLN